MIFTASKFRKDDIRITKTEKAIEDSVIALLDKYNFGKITVSDICKKAKISRATFYTHYIDKYDLMEHYLEDIRKELIKDVYNYEELEVTVNQFIHENQKLITNILKDANSETLELIYAFMSLIVEFIIKRKIKNKKSVNHTILFNFCIGGLVNLLFLQIKNNFSPNIKMMNPYIYKMLECVTDWDATQED